MHRRVAHGIGGSLLEIGAGNLNHVRYHEVTSAYDAIEPFRELWERSPDRHRIRQLYADILEVPSELTYDHILSVAVLEHLTDLPFVLARAALLLRDGGSFRAGFPSEGGLLWGVSWRTTTGLAYRLKRGLDYSDIMRHEHVNTAAEILAMLGYFYKTIEIHRFPFPLTHLSFYTVVIAQSPRLERCRAVCNERADTLIKKGQANS